MKLDDNPQMVVMLDHVKGSLENKIRQAYNSGYNDGFKAGVFEAWDDMREQLDKSLRQQYDRKTENSSEKANSCEHITEDGVTCAKYPACDDCPDNPLNKVKGSERLVKGSEQTDCDTCRHYKLACELFSEICKYEPIIQTETQNSNMTFETPQMKKIKTTDYCDICNHKGCDNCIANSLDDYCVPSGYAPKDIPQIDLEVTRNLLRTDCTGCRFVGAYDTQFPCVNCVRKNKDYYDSE